MIMIDKCNLTKSKWELNNLKCSGFNLDLFHINLYLYYFESKVILNVTFIS